MDANAYPKYLVKIRREGEPSEEKYLPKNEVAELTASWSVGVDLLGSVLEEDGRVRPITRGERSDILSTADRIEEEK